LHGLNTDTVIYELYDKPDVYIVAVQEHWLTPNNIQSISDINVKN